jgi:hypothetical protein
MRTLKKHRNALAAISQHLPAELLCAVFGALASILEKSDSKQRLQWIRVTHVCCHWREVALRCPSLWSHIDISYPQWILPMLGRSRMAPLVIKADMRSPSQKDDLLLVLGHMSRVRILDLTSWCSTPIIHQVMPKMTAPAPLLEKLRISMSRGHYQPTMPFLIFGGDAPELRHLELRNCLLLRQLPIRCLTHLQIYNASSDRASLFLATKDFVACLREMHQLQRACFGELLDVRSSGLEMRQDEPIVELPHLSNLQVSGGHLQCAQLMSYLSLPTDVSLKLNCTVTRVNGSPDIPSLINVLGVMIGTLMYDKPFQTLAMTREPPMSLYATVFLRAWSTVTDDGDHLPPDDAAKLNLRVVWDHRSSVRVGLVGQALCEWLPMSHVHTLYLSCFGTYEPHEVLIEVLRGLEEVQCLVVCGPAFKVVDILLQEEQRVAATLDEIYHQECDSDSEDDDIDTVDFDDDQHDLLYRHNGYGYDSAGGTSIPPIDIPFLPRLQHLLFQSTDFRDRGTPDDTGNISSGHALTHFLSIRDDRGAPVKMVELKRCRNLGDAFVRLQRLVEDFRADDPSDDEPDVAADYGDAHEDEDEDEDDSDM